MKGANPNSAEGQAGGWYVSDVAAALHGQRGRCIQTPGGAVWVLTDNPADDADRIVALINATPSLEAGAVMNEIDSVADVLDPGHAMRVVAETRIEIQRIRRELKASQEREAQMRANMESYNGDTVFSDRAALQADIAALGVKLDAARAEAGAVAELVEAARTALGDLREIKMLAHDERLQAIRVVVQDSVDRLRAALAGLGE